MKASCMINLSEKVMKSSLNKEVVVEINRKKTAVVCRIWQDLNNQVRRRKVKGN